MKIRRRPHQTTNTTNTTPPERPALLVPMGAVVLGGLLAFGRPRDALADGPILPGPAGNNAATAPLDVETRETIFRDARAERPNLDQEIDRLETNGRFEQLPVARQSLVLERHGAADRQTRSFLRGLVTSATFAAMDDDTQRLTIDVVTRPSARVRATYRATISDPTYKAADTEQRIEKLTTLSGLNDQIVRLDDAIRARQNPEFTKHATALMNDAEFATQPREIRALAVEALLDTGSDNLAWVVGLAASDTYRYVSDEQRAPLMQELGEDEPLFRAMYRATIGTAQYQRSPSAVRAPMLEQTLTAFEAIRADSDETTGPSAR